MSSCPRAIIPASPGWYVAKFFVRDIPGDNSFPCRMPPPNRWTRSRSAPQRPIPQNPRACSPALPRSRPQPKTASTA